MRTAVLISGRGSNMKALIAGSRLPKTSYDVALVISNMPDVEGLSLALSAGIATEVIDHKAYADQVSFDEALDATLKRAEVDLVCLAGFMRILSPWFVERWHDRLLNIHPSLLPAFKGLHTHERALAAGVRVHGCSVHLVRAELDDGPILIQGVVPVEQEDTATTLAARVLTVEHRCYPLALDLFASGQARVDGNRVSIDGGTPPVVGLVDPGA